MDVLKITENVVIIMDYLYTLTNQLLRFIESKAALGLINAKSTQIYNTCEDLLKEHGEKSDVVERLKLVKKGATSMIRLSDGIYMFGGSTTIDYNESEKIVDNMKESIKDIGRILKIELKEN